MTIFCKFSLLVTILLVLATGYAKAGGPLFEITCFGICLPQPPVIPGGDQYMLIGSCFYMRPGRNAFINITWCQTGSTPTEERIIWYCIDGEIVFDVASVETFTENGRTFIKQRSLNYPTIYLLRESGVRRTETLLVTNVSKAKSEKSYTAEIVLDNVVYASATSKIVVIPPPPVSGCVRAPVDICFLIDGSGSLGQTGFDDEGEFVINIVNQLTSNSNRYCYAIFDSNITSSFVLASDRAEFIRSLQAEGYPGGGTNLLVAIHHANTDLFTDVNIIDNRPRILFLLTDGRDDSGVESLRSISTSLARRDVDTYAIGFGISTDRDQLRVIGLNGSFVFLNFQDANEKIGNIASLICEGRKPCCTGPAGYRGRTGLKGPLGDSGDDGVPGICDTLEECYNFESSSAGSPGADGEKGETGPKGQTGEEGSAGMKGDRGRKGNNGEDGVSGQKGDKGLTGSDGEQGSDGQKGQDGEPGIRGDKGATGRKGLKGPRGSQGICTTQSCVGNQGDKGENGQKGSKGANGNRGNNGQKGLNGDKGVIGNTGDNGGTGNKGSTGPTGDAMEIKDIVNQVCSPTPSGKLYLDPTTKKLYYCENGRYTCISSNDTCEGEKPPCICSSSNTNCGQFIRNTMSQACGNNVAVDFILVVDDTSSMDRQQDWLRTYIPVLEEALKQRCIGNSTNFPNLYQIVAYGGNPSIGPGNNEGCDYANAEVPHFVFGCQKLCCQLSPPIPNPTFPISGLQAATANLQNLGGFRLTGEVEVAYAALEFALDNAVLRTTTRDATVIPVTILLTNGDADDYTDARFNSLLDRFVNDRPNMVFAFALNLGSFTTTNNLLSPFGAANNYEDGDLTVWHLPSDTAPATRVSVPYGSVSSDVSSSVTPNNEFRNVDRDFINLLMCSKRSSASFWDLDFVVNGGAADVTRFTDAFIRQNSDAIINRAQRFNCRLCYCTPSSTEVCVFVENEQICDCLQDNPSSDCSCVIDRLQEMARAGQSLTLSPAQANNILTDCGLTQTTTPSSANCRAYINSVN